MSTHFKRMAELSPQEKRVLLAELLRKKARTVKSFPLSFAQQRLWFLNQMDPGAPVYNVPLATRVTGPLDADALARCLNAVVRRHEILRATFATGEEGTPVQVVAPEARNGVVLAHALAQPARHLQQQLVAGGVAEGVVDRLEVVDVEQHHADRRALTLGQAELPGQRLDEQGPVGELGQGVVVGPVRIDGGVAAAHIIADETLAKQHSKMAAPGTAKK